MAEGVGMLFIHASTKSQMLYDVMSIRGYSGRLAGGRPAQGFGLTDLPYLGMAAFFLAESAYMKSCGRPLPALLLPAALTLYLLFMEALKFWKR
jgi:hypothetical protein